VRYKFRLRTGKDKPNTTIFTIWGKELVLTEKTDRSRLVKTTGRITKTKKIIILKRTYNLVSEKKERRRRSEERLWQARIVNKSQASRTSSARPERCLIRRRRSYQSSYAGEATKTSSGGSFSMRNLFTLRNLRGSDAHKRGQGKSTFSTRKGNSTSVRNPRKEGTLRLIYLKTGGN